MGHEDLISEPHPYRSLSDGVLRLCGDPGREEDESISLIPEIRSIHTQPTERLTYEE